MENYQLNENVPKIYDDVLEMNKLIESEQELFNDVNENSNQVMDNAFITSADSERIRDYEKLLKIKSSSSDTLEFRRKRVENRLSNKPPFTVNWLKQKLDEVIGVNEWKLYITSNTYNIFIKIRDMSDAWESELRQTLTTIIPANMIWELVENPYTTWVELHNFTWGDLHQYTWSQIKNL